MLDKCLVAKVHLRYLVHILVIESFLKQFIVNFYSSKNHPQKLIRSTLKILCAKILLFIYFIIINHPSYFLFIFTSTDLFYHHHPITKPFFPRSHSFSLKSCFSFVLMMIFRAWIYRFEIHVRALRVSIHMRETNTDWLCALGMDGSTNRFLAYVPLFLGCDELKAFEKTLKDLNFLIGF